MISKKKDNIYQFEKTKDSEKYLKDIGIMSKKLKNLDLLILE